MLLPSYAAQQQAWGSVLESRNNVTFSPRCEPYKAAAAAAVAQCCRASRRPPPCWRPRPACCLSMPLMEMWASM